jgi:hypothetical protein
MCLGNVWCFVMVTQQRPACVQAAWLSVLPMDALEVLRTSSLKAARAAQAVGKFFVHLGSSAVRHRLTLELRAGRAWRRAKRRLRALAMAPLLLGAELLKWLIIAARWGHAPTPVAPLSPAMLQRCWDTWPAGSS